MSDDLYTVYFGNPVFEPGQMQSTCRLGSKWHDRLDIGDVFVISGTEDDQDVDADYGLVTGLKLAPFSDLPSSWIDQEHDPKCRTYDGLAEEMRSIYGEDFDRGAECTMILFQPGQLPDEREEPSRSKVRRLKTMVGES